MELNKTEPTRPVPSPRRAIENIISVKWDIENVEKLTLATIRTIAVLESREIIQYCYVELLNEYPIERARLIHYNRKVSWYFDNMTMYCDQSASSFGPQTKTTAVSFTATDQVGNEIKIDSRNWQHALAYLSPKEVAMAFHDLILVSFLVMKNRLRNPFDIQWANNAQENLILMCRNIYVLLSSVRDNNKRTMKIMFLKLDISDCLEVYKDKFPLITTTPVALQVKNSEIEEKWETLLKDGIRH